MITAAQIRDVRSLPGIDQRMEDSDGQVRGNVHSLVKVVDALERAGVGPK